MFTILTNKAAKGKKGAIVAMIKGTRSENVIEVLQKIPKETRELVNEITLDMAGSMNLIAKKCFPNASRVIDRFHVQKLAFDAVQEIRIKHRWLAIDQENEAIQKAKVNGTAFKDVLCENGETKKQLLARGRYLLFKSEKKWTESQRQRAKVLFEIYPEIKKAYDLSQRLSWIYEKTNDKTIAMTRLAHWHEKTRQAEFKSFNTISRTIETHYQTILNYFDNRSTNASAESFNAKIKGFRSQFRGVKNIKFFLFRLTKIFA